MLLLLLLLLLLRLSAFKDERHSLANYHITYLLTVV